MYSHVKNVTFLTAVYIYLFLFKKLSYKWDSTTSP